MIKKTVKNSPTLLFFPAELVESAAGWYIKWYQTNPKSGKRELDRKTFDLNRIRDMNLRRQLANEIIEQINKLLPKGFPHIIDFNGNRLLPQGVGKAKIWDKSIEQIDPLLQTSLREAIGLGVSVRQQSSSRTTIRTFKSVGSQFIEWSDSIGISDLPVSKFKKRHAVQYMDYWTTKDIVNTTWNNKLQGISSIFTVLVNREYFDGNYFHRINKKKRSKTGKKSLTTNEHIHIRDVLKRKHYACYLATTLAFWSMLRQEEMAKLKVEAFKLDKGFIYLDEETSKTGIERYITIPDWYHDLFTPVLKHLDPEMYLFGEKYKACYTMIGENTLNETHKRYKQELIDLNVIEDRPGVSFSSWRKAGMNYYASILTERQHKLMSGHQSIGTTNLYLDKDLIVDKVKSLDRLI